MQLRARARLQAHSRLLLVGSLVITLVAIGACQGPPPTQYVIEVTRVVVYTPTPGTPTIETASETTPEVTTQVGIAATATAVPNAIPAPISNQIIIAEQEFEHGRMFWLEPNHQIWVVLYGEDQNSGTWFIRQDSWEEGEPEFDPALVAPADLFQPERGFGKLWRENPEIQEALGWALGAEVGLWTTYTYIYRGQVNSEGEFIAEPGYHTLVSRSGDTISFEESDGTWSITSSGQ